MTETADNLAQAEMEALRRERAVVCGPSRGARPRRSARAYEAAGVGRALGAAAPTAMAGLAVAAEAT